MADKGTRNVSGEQPVDEINVYLDQLERNLSRDYSPVQRAVFVAALAERHLARFETSPHSPAALVAGLQEALAAVWRFVQGQPQVSELQRLRPLAAVESASSQVQRLVELAVDACLLPENLGFVRQAAWVDCEAVMERVPGYPEDKVARQEVWRQPAVKDAIEHQQTLLMHAHLPVINEYIVDFLKQDARAAAPFRFETTTFSIPTPPGTTGDIPSGTPLSEAMKTAQSSPPGGLLKGLVEMLGKFQNGNIMEDLLKQAAKPGIVRSQTEQKHDQFLEREMANWTGQQRIAFCATLSERWLKEYVQFAAQEDWGEPILLRGYLEAVWDHLQGKQLTRAVAKRYSQKIVENAPDTEEFDAPLALGACEILDHALSSCVDRDNLAAATSAGMAACETQAMLGQGQDYRGDDPQEEERLWQLPAVQREIRFQLELLHKIRGIQSFTAAEISVLRQLHG